MTDPYTQQRDVLHAQLRRLKQVDDDMSDLKLLHNIIDTARAVAVKLPPVSSVTGLGIAYQELHAQIDPPIRDRIRKVGGAFFQGWRDKAGLAANITLKEYHDGRITNLAKSLEQTGDMLFVLGTALSEALRLDREGLADLAGAKALADRVDRSDAILHGDDFDATIQAGARGAKAGITKRIKALDDIETACDLAVVRMRHIGATLGLGDLGDVTPVRSEPTLQPDGSIVHVLPETIIHVQTHRSRVGESFGTQDEAATAALKEIYRRSLDEKVEYGGYIYRTPDGKFGFTEPVTQHKPGEVKFDPATIPAGAVAVSGYHSHGGDVAKPSDELFSDVDRNTAKSTGGLYVITPQGEMFKVTPTTHLTREEGQRFPEGRVSKL